MSPAAKRHAVRLSVELRLGSASQACRAVGLNRSCFYLESKRLHGRIVDLSREKPRYGYRRITAVLKREEETVNTKRMQRVRREERLQVRKLQRKLRRLGPTEAVRRVAGCPGEVWSWDFLPDQTANGSRFRVPLLPPVLESGEGFAPSAKLFVSLQRLADIHPSRLLHAIALAPRLWGDHCTGR